MQILKFLKDVNTGYKAGSMYKFSGNDGDRDEFKIELKNTYDYVHCRNRGDSYMIIKEPTDIDRLQFGIMTLADYLKFDVTKTYEDIKTKDKQSLIDTFIDMKALAMKKIENDIVAILVS